MICEKRNVSSFKKRALSSDGKLDIDKVIIVNSKKKKEKTTILMQILSFLIENQEG